MTMSSAPSRRIDQSAQIVGWRAAQARQAAQQRNQRGRRRGQGAPITAGYAGVRLRIPDVLKAADEADETKGGS
jgi:hypothetical protein